MYAEMASGYKRLYDHEEQIEQELIRLSWKRLHQCNSKLATTSQMASLMSFFSLVSVVELKLVGNETSEALVISLAVTTSLLVAATMIVKTVSCSLIPYLESVISVSLVQDVTRSPHESMIQFINITWMLGTILLPILFVLDLIIMAWIKFRFFATEAAVAATLILIPLLIVILAFGIVFFRQTIGADKACLALSKQGTLHRQLMKSRQAKWSDSISDSSSAISANDNFGESLTLLPENTLYIYTSYGSTLPNSFKTLCGFLD